MTTVYECGGTSNLPSQNGLRLKAATSVMLDENQIKEELATHFRDLTFFTTRRLTGRCIVAKKSTYYGADIFVKKDSIVVEAAIPDWKTRLLMGAGAAYKKITDQNFSQTALQVKEFLSRKYEVRLKT